MPHEVNGWMITGGHYHGTIKKGQKTIEFGDQRYFSNFQSKQVIDLRGQEHGGGDTFKGSVTGFKAAADLLHEKLTAHDQVAVHCANGKSRTSFSLIAYLISHQDFTYAQAAELLAKGQAERTDGPRFNINASNTMGNSYAKWVNSEDGLALIQNNDSQASSDRRALHVKSGYGRSQSDKSISCVMANISDALPRGLVSAQAARLSLLTADEIDAANVMASLSELVQ